MDIIKDAFIDTLKLIPILFGAYFLIELVEFKYGFKLRKRLQTAGNTSSIWGGLLGVLPQCGFSALASALFANRLIGYGALIAVFVSTSDEAVPILLANPKGLGIVLPLILIKVGLAILFGLAIDRFYKRKLIHQNLDCDDHDCHNKSHAHQINIDEVGCCGHEIATAKPSASELIIHPLKHTVRITGYIFLISLGIAYLFSKIPNSSLANLSQHNQVLQVLISAIFGLIPNCAASVAITNLYLDGVIGFGALLSGLITSAGVGYLVLFKENKNIKENVRIMIMMVAIGLICGLIANLF